MGDLVNIDVLGKDHLRCQNAFTASKVNKMYVVFEELLLKSDAAIIFHGCLVFGLRSEVKKNATWNCKLWVWAQVGM
jgi:hypothetical protein